MPKPTGVARLSNGGWLDHIVLGTPDTEATVVGSLGEQLGVTANIRTKPDGFFLALTGPGGRVQLNLS